MALSMIACNAAPVASA